jgi:hypothetical protein
MPYAEARPRRAVPTRDPADRTHPARILDALLGVWLFFSGFLWDHTDAQRVNAWTIGVLFVSVALVARAASGMRYVNTALSAWLFVSVWALPHISAVTRWNDGIVAVCVFALSLLAGSAEAAASARGAAGHDALA